MNGMSSETCIQFGSVSDFEKTESLTSNYIGANAIEPKPQADTDDHEIFA